MLWLLTYYKRPILVYYQCYLFIYIYISIIILYTYFTILTLTINSTVNFTVEIYLLSPFT